MGGGGGGRSESLGAHPQSENRWLTHMAGAIWPGEYGCYGYRDEAEISPDREPKRKRFLHRCYKHLKGAKSSPGEGAVTIS